MLGPFGKYFIAIAVSAAALAVRFPLWNLLGTSVPYMTFFAAVIISASHGGFGPGLMATALGALAADYFLVEPLHSFRIEDPGDRLALAMFCGVGSFITWLTDARRKALRLLVAETTERQATELSLRRSNDELNAIIQTSPLPVVAFDDKGNIDLWNPAAERVFGWTEGEVLGRPLPYVSEEKREEHLSLRARALAGESFVNLEITRQRKDGTPIELSLSSAPLRDTSGQQVGVMNIFVDITHRKQADLALRFANERLQRANKDLEEFAFISNHDLQEPLRMTVLYTQLLLTVVESPSPEARAYAKIIEDSVWKMQRLISDLAGYSRVIHSDDAQSESADLNTSFQRSVEVLAATITDASAVIESSVLPRVKANELQLAHVFRNVIDNALKYRKPEEQLRIVINAELSGPEWIVSVRDNGVGFEPEHSERIFGLFRRLHRDDEIPGSGIGLPIARRIIERYGGRMWAEGELGVGATVYFSLPADKTADQVKCG